MITHLTIYMKKKKVDSDWWNTCAKSVTPVQITHGKSGSRLAEKLGNFLSQ